MARPKKKVPSDGALRPGARGGAPRSAVGRRRKNFILPQVKIDRVRRLLGAATETEAVERALDAVADLDAFRRETDTALAWMIGRGGIEDHFDSVPLRGGAGRSQSSG